MKDINKYILNEVVTKFNVGEKQLNESFAEIGTVAEDYNVSYLETCLVLGILGSNGIHGKRAGEIIKEIIKEMFLYCRDENIDYLRFGGFENYGFYNFLFSLSFEESEIIKTISTKNKLYINYIIKSKKALQSIYGIILESSSNLIKGIHGK